MQFPNRLIVTGQEIDLVRVTERARQRIVELGEDIANIVRRMPASRIVIGLTGPSGAGKSFSGEALRQMLPEILTDRQIETVTIDAYHFSNDLLRQRGLLSARGRYDTYDVASLVADIECFRSSKAIAFPSYSRVTHEPVPNMIRFAKNRPALLILEGLWLLYEYNEWKTLRPFLDRVYYLDGDIETMRKRTVRRHITGGRSNEDAREFYERSDAVNSALVVLTKGEADVVWPLE